ncbi:VOC family protein [Coralliovum pocilloporae]|uniref:VOC family protein n=1 Tax=Coralliovum pocilloporae TaxID=3066369 RepID=UPI003307B660
MTTPITRGVHHVGLAVKDLDATSMFFTDCLGWSVVQEKPDYPAIFVSDGSIMLTLWRVAEPEAAVTFDRRGNVGLHHLALRVETRAALDDVFEAVRNWPGVEVEFAPNPEGDAPFAHCMIYEPSGIRLEFSYSAA